MSTTPLDPKCIIGSSGCGYCDANVPPRFDPVSFQTFHGRWLCSRPGVNDPKKIAERMANVQRRRGPVPHGLHSYRS